MGTCNGKPITPGVVASSWNGHYVSMMAVDTALDLGWQDEDARQASDEYKDSYGYPEDWRYGDVWFDMVDDAEQWLNEHSVGLLWYFYDGDFRVDEIGECPECGDDRFSDPRHGDTDCSAHLVVM